MIKKAYKILLIAVFALLALSISNKIQAREFEDIDKLGQAIELRNEDAETAVVIGEYVFTSSHLLTTQDVMLAARTISGIEEGTDGATDKTPIYGKMTIHTLLKNYKSKKWSVIDNLVGDTKLEIDSSHKLQIKYIDYDYVYEEVDTDVLLSEAQARILKNNFYGVNFDKDNKKVTFEVYDLNKKNSEIAGTGLLADIVKIVNNEKVTSITINGVTFGKEDVKDGAGPSSKAWQQFAVLLCNLTGKSAGDTQNNFKSITLGDLVNIKGDLTLTINIDETVARSQNNKTSEEYTIKFVYEPHTTIDNSIPKDDIDYLKEKLNYTTENTYTIEKTADGLYNVKGYVTEQKGVTGFGEVPTGFHFAYTLTLDEGIDLASVTVKLPKGDSESAGYNEAKFDETRKLTVLMEVEEHESTKYRDIIVEVDGKPTKIRINFENLKLEKSSKVTLDVVPSDKITSNEDKWHNWKEGDKYETTFAPVTIENGENIVKVSGFIPLFKFEEETEGKFPTTYAEHYLGIKLTKDGQDDKSDKDIIVKFLDDEGSGETNKITNIDFGENNSIYVLKWVNPSKADTTKKFTIEVDLDGSGETYSPYKVTVDWSELEFQYESKYTDAKIANNTDNLETEGHNGFISETDKKQFEDWKYNFDLENEDLTLSTEGLHYSLTGELKEQELDESAGFDSKEGYYVPIKIYGPTEEQLNGVASETNKWTVELNTEAGATKIVTPSQEDYNNGFITVLFKLKRDDTHSENEKITYKIDWDGDDKYFLPYEETIDYSTLQFKSASHVNVTTKKGGEELSYVFYEGEKIGEEVNEALKDAGKEIKDTAYRTFDGWYEVKSDSSDVKIEEGRTFTKDEDIELQAHYKLNVETFIDAVIKDLNSNDTTNSNDFTEDLSLSRSGNNITITVNKPNVPLTELADTSIPGTIAYILEKDEIEGIKLTVGGQNVDFNKSYKAENDKTYNDEASRDLLGESGKELKSEIVKGAKGAFDEELNKHEADATLDQLEYKEKTFTLKLGDTDKTVELVKADGTKITSDNDKTYTFKFDSDFVVVDQDGESSLEATDINSVLTKEYDTVYVDGDYTLENTLNLENKDVTITSLESAKGRSAEKTTLSVEGKENAVDVKSGTVTISNLKITGGTKSELRVDEEANVTVDNIDVSGDITPVESKDKGISAGIIVRGKLTASNITNEKEKYAVPTIALVTSYSYPTENQDGIQDGDKNDLGTKGSVTVSNTSNMSKNDKYYIVKKESGANSDKVSETYYGSFYYTNKDNSQIYFAGIIDPNRDPRPYDYMKIYYYNDELKLDELGYKEGEKPAGNEKDDTFKNFTINGKEVNDTTKAQDVLKAHDTTVILVNYTVVPSAALTFTETPGLSISENKISGTLTTQNEEGKFCIPVTLTSEKFKEGKTTVKVINPIGGEGETYTYNSSNENGIAPVSDTNTIQLQLEAIKASKIKNDNGKVYTIKLDIDGEEDLYQEEIYTVDYNDVDTLEEIINKAAEDTQNAKNLTYIKNNKVKGHAENFTVQYDKELGRQYYKDEKVEEYSFLKKDFIDDKDYKALVCAVKDEVVNTNDGRVYLNDWRYSSEVIVGMGVNELSLLRDLIKKDETVVNSIDRIKETEPNTYEITINEERLKSWLNALYLDVEDKEEIQGDVSEHSGVKLIVTLTEAEDGTKYIGSIKTSTQFSITDTNEVTTHDNSIDVKIENVGTTILKTPQQMLVKEEGTEATKEQIVQFIQDGETWWSGHTDSTKS